MDNPSKCSVILDKVLALPIARSKTNSSVKFIAFSVVIHFLLFGSIFDIYFSSPILTDIGTFHRPVIDKPPAKRLVLIVSDGLRAQSLFPNDLEISPFLRDVVNRRGAWGVSHTQVPTESRPGHAAIIAGIYEDVASVTRGWQENAVEFDSLFNRSHSTWSWGSPDIIHMFARGATEGRVHFHSYSGSMEDFSRHDSTVLDTWVFDRVTEFLKNATVRQEERSRLVFGDGLVFFLHLLGVDTSGHSDKPHSERYANNIRLVDKGVQNIETLFETFFDHDGRTAYVFTSDHGMTDWGSHGAGLDHETMTPLITWGAGFRGPQPSHDAESWNIPFVRTDVNQADICPLMAAVLGLDIPVNSVGKLPLTFLNVSSQDRMQMMRANALQMLEQFRRKRRMVKEASLTAFFREFQRLTPSVIEATLREAKNLASRGQHQAATELYSEVVDHSVAGLYYFHRYDRFFSGLCVSAIYLLWIACLLTSIIPNTRTGLRRELQTSFGVFEPLFFLTLLTGQSVVLIAEARPLLHWLYRITPIYLLWSLVRQSRIINFSRVSISELKEILVIVVGLELLIWSFFHRELLSLAILLHCVWQVCLIDKEHSRYSKLTFILGSVILSVFPLLPVIGGKIVLPLVSTGSILTVIVVLSYLTGIKQNKLEFKLLYLQIGVLCLACFVQFASHTTIAWGTGLPRPLQILSWSIFLFSMTIICFATRLLSADYNVLGVWIAITSVFTLLSIFYETVFLFSLYLTINAWIVMNVDENDRKKKESWLKPLIPPRKILKSFRLKATKDTSVNMNILRVCFSYMVFIILSFFGTGNMSSINSFDPRSVYCFLTIFKPFLMGFFMMIKIVLPLFLTTCLFVTLMKNVNMELLSRVTMVLADFMALHFFFLIRDWGSWLEIGTSISHYVISMAFTVVEVIFLSTGRYLLSD